MIVEEMSGEGRGGKGVKRREEEMTREEGKREGRTLLLTGSLNHRQTIRTVRRHHDTLSDLMHLLYCVTTALG